MTASPIALGQSPRQPSASSRQRGLPAPHVCRGGRRVLRLYADAAGRIGLRPAGERGTGRADLCGPPIAVRVAWGRATLYIELWRFIQNYGKYAKLQVCFSYTSLF